MSTRRGLLVAGLLGAAVSTAEWLRPRNRLADSLPPLALETDIPSAFGPWVKDSAFTPLLPDPGLQASLDALYTQILARTYVDRQGRRLMLSIAYGSDQGSEATSVHRPEFCYSAQGFRVRGAGVSELVLGSRRAVPLQKLIAEAGARFEPIIYWVTLADRATLPGLGRKFEQLRYGLRGDIPDGMLVRTSTVGLAADQSFDLQVQFLKDLFSALTPAVQVRVFGS